MKRNDLQKHSRGQGRRAFSLVELLVVIAISTILLALLFGPIISSFNLTRRARAVAQAQDAARFGLERLSRELGRATYIYDNGLAPVALPINYTNVPSQSGTFDIGGPLPTDWELIKYGRIDLVQPAVRQDTTDIIDPTTGQPVGGAELQPGVRGKRVVRYFLGLRNPFEKNADGSLVLSGGLPVVRLYANRYEFSTGPRSFNPVILYRAEYDPRDPNLFDLDYADYNSVAVNSGGFNDPDFFYSTKSSDTTQKDAKGVAANGKTYGENWQAIAQPVLVSENVDLIRWNRVGAVTNRVEKDANDKFSPTTSFSPVSVPGDVAAPGFLTSGGVETPAAIPTLYQTKYGAWGYPYKVTVLRGSTNFNGGNARTVNPSGAEPFGVATITIDRDVNGNVVITGIDAPTTLTFPSTSVTNTLGTTGTGIYSVYSPTTRKLFVKMPTLTFAIDTDRGRIETAFPPLMGTKNASGVGVPYYKTTANTVAVVSPGSATLPIAPVIGDVIPTVFKIDTRDSLAGTGSVLINQGLIATDLFTAHYLPVDTSLTGPNSSPLDSFGWTGTGGTAAGRGVRIIPGSERISAPVVVNQTPTSWIRVAATTDIAQPLSTPIAGKFEKVLERQPRYHFDYDLFPENAASPLEQLLTFDTFAATQSGLPAADTATTGIITATTPGNFLTGTYLWQNNFSYDPRTSASTWGYPLDANGSFVASNLAPGLSQGIKPESDIFRVDYTTRQQFNINLGARIYDPTDGRAQSIQVTDKVVINNAIR